MSRPAESSLYCAALLLSLLLQIAAIRPLAGQAHWGAPFLRHPAPSPDGRLIAFSYAGDIWLAANSGGAARRLTVNPGRDAHPVWSPEGGRIAFTSDREGHSDIFVVDTAGSVPLQLTYHGSSERPVDWTPDGREVIFLDIRDLSPRRIPTPYRVPADGSRMPARLWSVLASDVRLSGDGKRYVFTRGWNPWWRKGYRGSSNFDLWHYEPSRNAYSRLTGSPACEHTPMWAPDQRSLYYVSEITGAANIFRRALEAPASEPGEAVTAYTGDGVRWARSSADGSLIAFERGTDIFLLSTLSPEEPRRLEVSLPADSRENPLEWKTFTAGAESFALSPDEKQAALTVRGELFAVENDKEGVTRRITRTPTRESAPRWLPDSLSLVFTGDSAGNGDIYRVASADSANRQLFRAAKLKFTRLTDSPQEEHGPLPSPDGKLIAYIRGTGDIMLMDAEGGNQRLLLAGWDEPRLAWSPDSRWLAFSRNDIEFNEDVWIVPVDGSAAPVNASRHPDLDSHPVWSADGRKLAFLSRRSGENNSDIYFVFLRREDEELSRDQRRWLAQEAEKDKDKNKKPVVPEVRVDFEGLHKRLHRVTSLPGAEGSPAISPDGRTFAFSAETEGENDLYSISWEGKDLERLTTGAQSPTGISYSADGKTIYYLRQGGKPSKITLAGKKAELLPLSARLEIDLSRERLEVFQEAWRTLNSYFYDPRFHSADWAAIREKYLPAVAANIPDRGDFDDLVRLMTGELNASHLGISPPGDGTPAVPIGALGVRLDENYSGEGFRIAYVFRRGPADRPESRLSPGELIVSVEGRAASPGDNLYRLLYDLAGKPVLLQVRARDGKALREVLIRPVDTAAESNLIYEDWVESRRALVDSLSGGRLGYIHIRAMGWDSFENFERDLYSEGHGKEGLLVDVRNNPGGWITDYLLAVLTVKRHAYTIPRGAEISGYPQDRLPLYSWVKPVAALCNELSFSNAEIFSHAFKTLGLGPLIGQTTNGAVISTGATALIDGSVFRVPFRGWFVEGSGIDMEREGCVPDIIVDEPPGEEGSGRDSQLERAVLELLNLVE